MIVESTSLSLDPFGGPSPMQIRTNNITIICLILYLNRRHRRTKIVEGLPTMRGTYHEVASAHLVYVPTPTVRAGDGASSIKVSNGCVLYVHACRYTADP